MEQWTIYTGPHAANDAAVRAAVEDLESEGPRCGIAFQHALEAPKDLRNLILVGDATRNAMTQRLVASGDLYLTPTDDPQAFQIVTCNADGGRLVVVAGASLMGDVYGLYWIWDRMRVHGSIPELNVTRSPRLRIRLTGALTPTEIRNALRHTANWVSGPFIDDLVPWASEPEATANASHRDEAARLAYLAHGHHLKCLAIADEFSYHPTLLDEFGARLHPADPALWDALQAKYRRLFTALPELDGVQIRTGELTRVTGAYRPLDIMHDPPDPDWPLEKRYRTFIQKMHQVVVDEFDKIYFHRTWVTNTTEQHSDPEVYRAIFTDEVPTRNLYLSPYLSKADRWYYQPYNPTFNLTPHAMLVLLSRLDYHAAGGVNVFPSFPGQYFQGGLKVILAPGDSNVKGVHFGVPSQSGWDTDTLTAYTVFRLAWEPDLDLRTIAEDFAAIYFGRDAAVRVAEILLLSHTAYKDGLYVKPVAESLSWNTLPHLRLTTFEAKGYPVIDRGRAHIEWLRESMYVPSKSRIDVALTYLDRGRDAARRMQDLYAPVPSKASDQDLARRVGESLELTRLLVETNNLYVRTCFAYFRYREEPTPEHRETLAQVLAELKSTRAAFVQTPGFQYQLFGIDELMRNADAALDDLDGAEAALAAAPDREGVRQVIQAHQDRHARAVDPLPKGAFKLLTWRGKVDGKDIVSVRGDTLAIEHIQDDPIQSAAYRFHARLPKREVTVLVRDVESRTLHPFVIEQPNAANDYTFKLYIADRGRGYAWWEFELYFVEKRPQELGLTVPWQ